MDACIYGSCEQCGRDLELKQFHSIAFPSAKPFWRLTCVCGWFGPPSHTAEALCLVGKRRQAKEKTP